MGPLRQSQGVRFSIDAASLDPTPLRSGGGAANPRAPTQAMGHDEMFVSSPVIVGGDLFLRSQDELFCISQN